MKELANLEFLRQVQRPVSVISAPFIKLRVETTMACYLLRYLLLVTISNDNQPAASKVNFAMEL